MADHADTLLNMSPATRRGWIYRPIRVHPWPSARRLRAAAAEANMSVAAFIRAAIAVYARDGYCQRVANSKPDNPPQGLSR